MAEQCMLEVMLKNIKPEVEIESLELKSCLDYKALIRCKMVGNDFAEEVKSFIEKFSTETCTNWIVRRTFPNLQKLLFRKIFVCQHSDFNKKAGKRANFNSRDRNKRCNAQIDIKIKKKTKTTIRRDKYLKNGLNAQIQIDFQHTHRIKVAEALSYLRMSTSTRETFIQYFIDGYSPAAAKKIHESNIMANCEDGKELVSTLANTSLNPTDRQIYNLYDKWSPDGSPWQPTKYSRICSRHFIGNAKSFHPKSPSFVPTIFPKIYGTKRKNGKTAASAKDSDDSDQPANSSTHSAGKNDNIEIFKAEDMQKEDMLPLSTDPLAVGNAGKNYIFIKTEDNLEPADTNESSAVTYNDVKVECPELSDLKEVDPSDDIPYVDTEEYKIFFIDKDISSLNQTTDSTPGKRPGSSQDLGNCPQKRKRTAVSEGESTKGDKSQELGKCWTTIHRKLVPDQQRIAERAIISILSEACRGKLNQNSVVINGVSIKDL